jgi:hypothetical protein
MKLADIKENWDMVRPCLEKLKTMGEVWWTPDDIHASCLCGISRLYIAEEDPDAFVIARIDENKRTLERSLFIWIAWGGKNHGTMDKYLPFIEELARVNNCEVMKMQSPRRGFERTGWKPVMIDYTREVH